MEDTSVAPLAAGGQGQRHSADPAVRDRWLLALAALLSLAIFAVDLRLPLGPAVGMLYVTVILLGLWTRAPAYPVAAAGVATILTMIDLTVGWTAEPNPAVYVNGPMMTLTFWATAALVARFRRLQDTAASQVRQLTDLKYALDQAAIVATTDVTGRITFVNDTFCTISKYSREELLGQDHRIINSKLHPPEMMRELWHTIAAGRVWHGELRNRAKDGTFYWVDTTIVPFLNERGKPYQYTAIRSDITQRKAAEAQLREQESLARLGQMAAVVAHEVKNPLAGIRAAVEVMRSRRAAGDPELPIMREIVARIDALSELIRDLLLFASPRPLNTTAVDVLALLEELADTIRRDPVHAAVDVSVAGTPVVTRADREVLRAALFNLYLNAAQAMGGKGSLRVRLDQAGTGAVIEIRDSGPGIPAELRQKVLEPFFTTKTRGGGLGLPMAVRSIALHGGTLDVECPPEGGTVMRARLPIVNVTPRG